MNQYFKDILVDPYNYKKFKYEGTYKNNEWYNGLLISEDYKYTVKNGIPLFDSGEAGDEFNQEDIDVWVNGHFKNYWENKLKYISGDINIYDELCTKVAELSLPTMDIASGPGLGLLPRIIKKNSNNHYLATDACPSVCSEWQKFLSGYEYKQPNLDFASFDINKMPIQSNSINVITSFIGLSSVRHKGIDNMEAVHEVARILKKEGYLFAIENEWCNREDLEKVFYKWGKENWFKDDVLTWKDKFTTAGLKIVEEKVQDIRELKEHDNELGVAAKQFGIKLGLKYTAYVLTK